MNYKIIQDEKLLLDFIDFLPKLQKDETYYVVLLARNKYCKEIVHLNSDRQQLRRLTTDKEHIYKRLKQMECEMGSYFQKNTPIPQEAISPYITLNPRNIVRATQNTMSKFFDLLSKPYNGFDPSELVMSELAKSCGRKVYIDFDFDDGDLEKTIDILKQIINFDCVKILKTRGGFHVIIKTEDIQNEYKKTWYKNISSLDGCDVKSNSMIPIPGTYQGGFVPYFIK